MAGVEGVDVARLLAAYVSDRGGVISSDGLRDFYSRHRHQAPPVIVMTAPGWEHVGLQAICNDAGDFMIQMTTQVSPSPSRIQCPPYIPLSYKAPSPQIKPFREARCVAPEAVAPRVVPPPAAPMYTSVDGALVAMRSYIINCGSYFKFNKLADLYKAIPGLYNIVTELGPTMTSFLHTYGSRVSLSTGRLPGNESWCIIYNPDQTTGDDSKTNDEEDEEAESDVSAEESDDVNDYVRDPNDAFAFHQIRQRLHHQRQRTQ